MVKLRRPNVVTKISLENILLLNTNRNNSKNYLRTLIKINNYYIINILLDRGVIPNIISLDLVKRLDLKELIKDFSKDIIVNG